MVYHIGFRLVDDRDPEERLEGAALWKAMYDHHGPDRISPLLSTDVAPEDWILFGRQRGQLQTGQEPVSNYLPYWEDPAFLRHCGRSFEMVAYEGLSEAVGRLHAQGKSVFLKSTRLKHFTRIVPVGTDVADAMDGMAYSFMDGGPDLMVQEYVEMRYEHRFFVIGRKIITSSPVMISLTPLDHPLSYGACYRTPDSRVAEWRRDVEDAQSELAGKMAYAMVPEHAVIDIAMVWNSAAVIEMNPMVLGQAGLYASSVEELAHASDVLIRDFVPTRRKAVLVEDEEDFIDGGELSGTTTP